MSFIMEIPENINELVKKSNCNYSWETRLAALDVLKEYNCQQSRDVITRLALHDKVYEVKKAAFLAAQALNITKNGNPIRLGKKDIGYKPKDFTKIFLRIKRDKKMEELDLNLFKETLKILNAEMYDVMNYVHRNTFDSWVETTFKNLPKK
jgi:hypothetical protein